MIDQLLKIVQQNSSDCVVKNKDVPDQYNQAVQEEVTNSIENTLAKLLNQGKTDQVLGLFGSAAQGQSASLSGNPIAKLISDNIVKTLGQKFKFPPAVSGVIVSTLLPRVLGQFSKKVADPKDKSIDMNSVIGTLLGGGNSGQAKPSGGVDFNSILGSILSEGGAKSGSGGGGFDVGGLLGSIFGGNKAAKASTPKRVIASRPKTTTTGKKITKSKTSPGTKSKGQDLLGGLLGKILK